MSVSATSSVEQGRESSIENKLKQAEIKIIKLKNDKKELLHCAEKNKMNTENENFLDDKNDKNYDECENENINKNINENENIQHNNLTNRIQNNTQEKELLNKNAYNTLQEIMKLRKLLRLPTLYESHLNTQILSDINRKNSENENVGNNNKNNSNITEKLNVRTYPF